MAASTRFDEHKSFLGDYFCQILRCCSVVPAAGRSVHLMNHFRGIFMRSGEVKKVTAMKSEVSNVGYGADGYLCTFSPFLQTLASLSIP